MSEIALPTSSWREGDVSMLALLEGRLEESAGRLTSGGTLLIWPAGFRAERPDDGPVLVLDPEGNVVLEVGDRFGVAGGSGAEGTFVMNGYPRRIDE